MGLGAGEGAQHLIAHLLDRLDRTIAAIKASTLIRLTKLGWTGRWTRGPTSSTDYESLRSTNPGLSSSLLGEIHDSQRAAWQRSIRVFGEECGQARELGALPCRPVATRGDRRSAGRPRAAAAGAPALVGRVLAGQRTPAHAASWTT